jgi:hypothetical protein
LRTADESEADKDYRDLQTEVEEVVDGAAAGVDHHAGARMGAGTHDEGKEQTDRCDETEAGERHRGVEVGVFLQRAEQRGDLLAL